ncbi:hypothetical protein [Cognatiyoonia sp.]|uniref:hypothetical protein n=1 Tax=Cognatiyoonia sp. TaxID=2211652 RepID=UPI003F694DDE
MISALVMLVGMGAFQRYIAQATIARLEGQAQPIQTANSELLHVAIALAIEPDYFDKPMSHTEIVMDLIRDTPGNENMDEAARIREAFRLAREKDHYAILADYLTDLRFANGCIGIEDATTALQVAEAGKVSEVGTAAIAALAATPELGSEQTRTIASSAKRIARKLNS